jgi:peptide/nickel transport system permease protein
MIDIRLDTADRAAAQAHRPRRRRGRGSGKLLAGGLILAIVVVSAASAPLITSGNPFAQDLTNRLAPPSWDHPIGTDQLGRDVWTRLVYAARVDLRVGVLGALLPMLIGSLIGIAAGFGGRRTDTVLMRFADIVLSFPLPIFLIALVGLLGPGSGWLFLGPGEVPVLIAFALVAWVVYARLLRTEIRRVRGLDYVAAAIAGGLSSRRVLLTHVLPNAIGQSIVYVFVEVGLAILALSTLSFLGLGVPLPIAEWGAMVAQSRSLIQTHWWLMVAPGLAIAFFGVGLALIGDGLDDRLKAT